MTIFDRHALLLGEEGRRILATQTIVVAGLGGIGSLVAVMLVHAGFGSIVLIDHDFIEESNRPRIIGSRPSDVDNQVSKVEIARRYISECMPECDVRVYQVRVEDESIPEELIAADAIVVGTDSAKSRAYVNEICHRYYVPLLDLGVEFVAPGGELNNEVGKVNLVMPGTPCLWCTGHVSSEMILAEDLPEMEARKRVGEGYIRDLFVPQPSMMPFNGEVASRGVQLLVRQLSGLAQNEESVFEQRSFLGLNGRPPVRLVKKRQRDDCPFCVSGAILGRGDDSEMLIC